MMVMVLLPCRKTTNRKITWSNHRRHVAQQLSPNHKVPQQGAKKEGIEIFYKAEKKPQGGHSSGWDVCEGEKRKEKQKSGKIGGNYPCCFTALCSSARPLLRCVLVHVYEWQVQQGNERKRRRSLEADARTGHARMHAQTQHRNRQAIGVDKRGASMWEFAWFFF